MIRYLTLSEYFWLAEQVTGTDAGVLAKVSRSDLADSALHAPKAGFGDEEFYPDIRKGGRSPLQVGLESPSNGWKQKGGMGPRSECSSSSTAANGIRSRQILMERRSNACDRRWRGRRSVGCKVVARKSHLRRLRRFGLGDDSLAVSAYDFRSKHDLFPGLQEGGSATMRRSSGR